MALNGYENRKNLCGEIVRFLRGEHKLTQEGLAIQLQQQGINITQLAISGIETGVRCVPDYELRAFAYFFDVSMESLVNYKEYHRIQNEYRNIYR